jgi:hypothetical protein
VTGLRRTVHAAVAAAVAAALLAGPAGAAERKVPFGWMGTMIDGPLGNPDAPLEREMRVMANGGVEQVRAVFYWDQAEPVAGGPIDFSRTDRLVAAAAARRMQVLAVVLRAPAWARKNPDREWSPPQDPAAFARFVGVLVRRYGSDGSFWRERPELPAMPVRRWQIWNEPAGFDRGLASQFWADRGESYLDRYVAMLRLSAQEIRAADRSGRVVLAGLFGKSWLALEDIVRAGGRGFFDEAAAHIFTGKVSNVVTTIEAMRKAMTDGGMRRPAPIAVTELSWTASKGIAVHQEGYEVTRKQQAKRLRAAYTTLAQRRKSNRISGVFWYTWSSGHRSDTSRFDYAGLRRTRSDGSSTPLPAFRAYRATARRLEGCAKRGHALACRRR